MDQARQAMESGDPAGALQIYRSMLDRDPANGKAHNNAGAILAAQGQMREALVHFEAAVQADPTDPSARLNLARVLVAEGRSREALPHLDQLKKGSGEKEAVFLLEAEAWVGAGDYESAERLLSEGLPQFPLAAKSHWLMGDVQQHLGKPDQALLHYCEAAWLAPETPRAPLGLAEILANQGAIQEAREHLAEARRLLEEAPDPHLAERFAKLESGLGRNEPLEPPAKSGSRED